MTRKKDKQLEGQGGQNSSASRWRLLISVVLLFHLSALVVPPFLLQARPLAPNRPSSPAGMPLNWIFQRYTSICNLAWGYAFFAPNPPEANCLIEYTLIFDDGRPPVTRRFPDIDRHWPRLLYHRHFMLSSQLNDQFVPPPPDSGVDEAWLKPWKDDRARYEAKWNSFKNHLKKKYGATEVVMHRLEHWVPPPNVSPDKLDLRDPGSYRQLKKDDDPQQIGPLLWEGQP